MRKEDISEALNDIDFEMVEDAYNATNRQKKAWRRWAALAACLALILGAAVALPTLLQKNLSDVPIWDASHFPVNQILRKSNPSSIGAGTTAYTMVSVSDSEQLRLNPVPWDKYMNIYELTDITAPKSDAELQEFADTTLPKLADALGIACPLYKIKDAALYTDFSPYDIDIDYYGRELRLTLSSSSDDGSQIVLDGKPLQIDPNLPDWVISASLRPIKKSLFEIFGVSFSDVKIQRGDRIRIYFYNKNAHYLNEVFDVPLTDYISITYYPDGSDNTYIHYTKNRVDLDTYIPLVAKAKRLPLKKAEELLKKGYVFSGSCCLRTPEEEVVFDSYDFVELEYIFTHDSKEYPTLGIPVYIFYKELHTKDDGTIVYAKTYVPAIEISGYEEFFEQEAKANLHR